MKKLTTLSVCFIIILLTYSCAVRKSSECQDKCNLKPETGFCKAAIPKYYFNNKTGKCEQFTWGGCEGVVPFQTMEECKECKCKKTK